MKARKGARTNLLELRNCDVLFAERRVERIDLDKEGWLSLQGSDEPL